jgi:hypothetical protein
MPAAHRLMRRLNSRSPTSVVNFHMPLRMGSFLSCRANRTRQLAIIWKLSSTRLRTIHRCVDLHSRQTRQPASTLPESEFVILPPNGNPIPRILTPSHSSPRRARRRSQPSPTRTVWCTSLSPRIRTAAYQPIPPFTHQYSSLLPRPCLHHLPAERGPLAALSCCRYCMRGRHDAGYCCARGSERRKRLPPRSPSPPRSQTIQKNTSTIKATGARETACCRAIARAQRDRRR